MDDDTKVQLEALLFLRGVNAPQGDNRSSQVPTRLPGLARNAPAEAVGTPRSQAFSSAGGKQHGLRKEQEARADNQRPTANNTPVPAVSPRQSLPAHLSLPPHNLDQMTRLRAVGTQQQQAQERLLFEQRLAQLSQGASPGILALQQQQQFHASTFAASKQESLRAALYAQHQRTLQAGGTAVDQNDLRRLIARQQQLAEVAASPNEGEIPSGRPSRAKAIKFPVKLMSAILEFGKQDCVEWLPDNRSFAITNQERFSQHVLKQEFKASKYTSFVRKLNRWGFIRLTAGNDVDCFHHQHFRRDRPQDAKLIRALPRVQKSKKTHITGDEKVATSEGDQGGDVAPM